MEAITLLVKKRDITGKQVKKLRFQGLIPASVFGREIKSISISVPQREFLQIYRKVGETGLIELKLDNQSHHTLVSNVQIHPVSRLPLHVEFHAVNLKEKITANVPLELIGESPAVQNNIGLLLQTLNEVEVEALPADLPEKIGIDVSKLANIDEQITVGELAIPQGVTLITPSEEIVVKVASAVSEETKKELEAEEAAKAAAAAEAGAAPAESSTPTPESSSGTSEAESH